MKTNILNTEVNIPDKMLDKLKNCGHPFRASYYERMLGDVPRDNIEKELITLINEDIKAGEIMATQINGGKL